jgi:hypothetical protein
VPDCPLSGASRAALLASIPEELRAIADASEGQLDASRIWVRTYSQSPTGPVARPIRSVSVCARASWSRAASGCARAHTHTHAHTHTPHTTHTRTPPHTHTHSLTHSHTHSHSLLSLHSRTHARTHARKRLPGWLQC